jgi:hypothetical protein
VVVTGIDMPVEQPSSNIWDNFQFDICKGLRELADEHAENRFESFGDDLELIEKVVEKAVKHPLSSWRSSKPTSKIDFAIILLCQVFATVAPTSVAIERDF